MIFDSDPKFYSEALRSTPNIYCKKWLNREETFPSWIAVLINGTFLEPTCYVNAL